MFVGRHSEGVVLECGCAGECELARESSLSLILFGEAPSAWPLMLVLCVSFDTSLTVIEMPVVFARE